MLSQSRPSTAKPCPTADEWLQALRGQTSAEQWTQFEEHFQQCTDCEATVDALTEHSDTCVRELCQQPSTDDDEPVFQSLYNKLISSPEFTSHSGQEHVSATSRPLPFRMGNYELLAPLGQGANGNVFHARHIPLDRNVVIKLLKPNQDFDPASVDRFMQEVRAVGQLDHPHIVRATDAGETDGQHFLTMEYVPGVDLSTVLNACAPLHVRDVCEVIRQAALGLAYLHESGFVHRDVKPSNLLLTSDGQTKLLDLGLVHSIGDGTDNGEVTPKPPHGTADYMSPEQWLDFDRVDYRSDLYSLGCTLCKLLTGLPPFRPLPAGFATKSAAHCGAPIPHLRSIRPDVPEALQKLLERLLAKQAGQRFATARGVAAALTPLAQGANLQALAVRSGLPATFGDNNRGQLAYPRSKRSWTWRQSVLAGWLAISCLVLVGLSVQARFVSQPDLSKFLETQTWRSLTPATPNLLGSTKNISEDAWSAEGEGEFQIRSPQLTLLNLGQPIIGTFRLAVDFPMPIGHYHVGVFFKYRKTEHLAGFSHEFESVEFVQDELDGKPQWRLVWSVVALADDLSPSSHGSIRRTSLADIKVSPPVDLASLEVELGSSGFPTTTWCGERLPIDRWTLSYEGRQHTTVNRARLSSEFLGHLGLVAGDVDTDESGGTEQPSTTIITEFRQPRLKYFVNEAP